MTYWRLYYHLIWGTKNRLPLIAPDFESSLYSVLVSKASALGASVHAVGGTQDHIHLAASIPPSISISSFTGQLKGNSAHYINHILLPPVEFKWQHEYGVVSFGSKQLETLVHYVLNQKQHHAQDTLLALLEQADPK
jgi:putative transposase